MSRTFGGPLHTGLYSVHSSFGMTFHRNDNSLTSPYAGWKDYLLLLVPPVEGI